MIFRLFWYCNLADVSSDSLQQSLFNDSTNYVRKYTQLGFAIYIRNWRQYACQPTANQKRCCNSWLPWWYLIVD